MEEDVVRVFIGSSKEGKEYAEALQLLIDESARLQYGIREYLHQGLPQ